MELLEKKQAIRAEILSRRDGLAAADRQKDSHAIAERILGLPAFDDARIIHLYLSVRNEVETAEILQRGLALGKTIVVPVITSDRPMGLRFVRVEEGPPKNLERGPRGILQPLWDPRREVLPERVDLWLIPGVAFDSAGRRIGYGGGCYDRVLRKAQGLTAGLAFEIQMVEGLPEGRSDVRVHRIVTEKRVIICSNGIRSGNTDPG